MNNTKRSTSTKPRIIFEEDDDFEPTKKGEPHTYYRAK